MAWFACVKIGVSEAPVGAWGYPWILVGPFASSLLSFTAFATFAFVLGEGKIHRSNINS
jgi:hypothetical protein